MFILCLYPPPSPPGWLRAGGGTMLQGISTVPSRLLLVPGRATRTPGSWRERSPAREAL